MSNPIIPVIAIKVIQREVAGWILQIMLKIEHRCPDPAERWHVLRRAVSSMARGEI